MLALVVTLALLLPGLAGADDASALYEQNCVSCHGSEVFTRPDRRVQSLGGLASQVRMCEQNLGLQWFDEDVQAVVGLLNREYYHFDQPAAD
ncbi:MAG: cytochrome c [Chromatiaceae bacterium]|nr:MAG: cytochrome c [Chromatiaceae bacterium]